MQMTFSATIFNWNQANRIRGLQARSGLRPKSFSIKDNKTMREKTKDQNSCCLGTESCNKESVQLGRRQFVMATGLTAAMALADPTKVMAGPFDAARTGSHHSGR